MKWPDIFPSADILQQIEGLESGLRKRRRVGTVASIFAILGIVLQIIVILNNSEWFKDLAPFILGLPGVQQLSTWLTAHFHIQPNTVALLPLFLIVPAVVVVGWAKFWLKQSQEPFQYSCAIDEFKPIRPEEDNKAKPSWLPDDLEEKLLWLSHDLAEKLSRRVGRLRFRGKERESTGDSSDSKSNPESADVSHIQISGSYVIRRNREGDWVIEILPRVRIGLPSGLESLGHPVTYKLGGGTVHPKPLDKIKYERVLERLYFSVATEVYQQIRRDVEGKIALLPTAYFRAVALFHEAEDYAKSNTLDSYREAGKLYWRAAELFDPNLKRLPESSWRRFVSQWAWRSTIRIFQKIRGSGSYLFPRLAHRELMCAQAETGHANMLIYQRILAPPSGARLIPVFETGPIAKQAVARLEGLPADTPDRREKLFDAYVTCALALNLLDSNAEAKKQLEEGARALDPQRTENDIRYLFAKGAVEGHRSSRIDVYRRATEMESRFEVAQWKLASESEKLWRSRRTLEPEIARVVLNQYDKVLAVNPGNISAWANRGFIQWLIGTKDELHKAEEEFKSGLEYKEIKPQTFVFRLNYGLARIAAERGNFPHAYELYRSAISSFLAEGAYYGKNSLYYDPINEAMVKRFERCERAVKEAMDCQNNRESKAVTSAVYSFVLNDYGLACLSFYGRSGDSRFQRRAKELFDRAKEANPEFVLPHFYLFWEALNAKDLENAGEHIARVTALEPRWLLGIFAEASYLRAKASAEEEDAHKAKQDAEKARESAHATRAKAKEARDQAKAKRDQSISSFERSPAYKMPSKQQPSLLSSDPSAPLQSQYGVPREPTDKPTDTFERDAKRFDAEAENAESEATDYEKRANESNAVVEASKQAVVSLRTKATEKIQELLPHRWLWSCDQHSGRRQFDWSCLRREAFMRELKWEREFDDVQVNALYQWALLVAESDHIRQERPGGSYLGPAGVRLLQCIKEHFWPNEFDLLIELRDRDKEQAESYSKQLFSQVRYQISQDPFSFLNLSWAIYLGQQRNDLLKYVLDAIRGGQLSADFHRWISDCFPKDSNEDEILSAYHQAFDQAKEERNVQWSLNLGLGYGMRGRWRESLDALQLARQLDLEDNLAVHQPAFYHREIGRALWELGSYNEAVAEFEMIDSQCDELSTNWRSDLVDDLTAEGAVSELRQRLRTWLERERHTYSANANEHSKEDIFGALLHLAKLKYGKPAKPHDFTVKSLSSPSGATPIVVELDGTLFSPIEAEPDSHLLLKKYLPDVRTQIQKEFLVKMPGVIVRRGQPDKSLQSYRIFIDEVPFVTRWVNPTEKFCPNPEALHENFKDKTGELEFGWNPLTAREDGAWLNAESLPEGRLSPLWDYFEYLANDLGSVARSFVPIFLEDVTELLSAWQSEGPRAQSQWRKELIARALPDVKTRFAFTRVLQNLAKEAVKLENLQAILESFALSSNLHQSLPLLEELRWKLRKDLDGNTADSQFLKLPPAFEREVENSIQRREGRTFLAMPLGMKEKLLKALKPFIEQRSGGYRRVIVTQSALIRPFVRRLVEFEFPKVPVLSSQELLPQVGAKVAEYMDYQS
jgi:hypothetical protein